MPPRSVGIVEFDAVGLIGRDDLVGCLMAGNPKIKRAQDVMIRICRIPLVRYAIKHVGARAARTVVHSRDKEKAEEALRLGNGKRRRVRKPVGRLGRRYALVVVDRISRRDNRAPRARRRESEKLGGTSAMSGGEQQGRNRWFA